MIWIYLTLESSFSKGNVPFLRISIWSICALLLIFGCSHVSKWFLLWSWRWKVGIKFCMPYVKMSLFRSRRPNVLCKKGIPRNFAKFTEKSLSQSLFFNKVLGLSLQLYSIRDSDTGVFLWSLRNFKEHIFLHNISSACFCLFKPSF